jgi:hypothetical protein
MKLTKLVMFVGIGLLLSACLIPENSMAQNSMVQAQWVWWNDIIGIIEPGNFVGSGSGKVTGGDQPWSTEGGFARINLSTGRIRFEVRGLVFAGGNDIGTPGSITQVKGTLVCDTDGSAGGGNSVLVDTDLVSLSNEGNAYFTGTVASIPSVCLTEPDIAFLIRTSSGKWIANGAVRR